MVLENVKTYAMVQVGDSFNDFLQERIKSMQKAGAIVHHYWYEKEFDKEKLQFEIKDLEEHYFYVEVYDDRDYGPQL